MDSPLKGPVMWRFDAIFDVVKFVVMIDYSTYSLQRLNSIIISFSSHSR